MSKQETSAAVTLAKKSRVPLPKHGLKFSEPIKSHSKIVEEEDNDDQVMLLPSNYHTLEPAEFMQLNEQQRREILEERKQIFYKSISQLKVRKVKEMTIAEYVPELNMILVIQAKGKVVQTMGIRVTKVSLPVQYNKYPLYFELADITRDKFAKIISAYKSSHRVHLLYPEEALYLIDSNSLALYSSDSNMNRNDSTSMQHLVDFELMNEGSNTIEHLKLRSGHLCTSIQDSYSLLLRNSDPRLLNIFIVYSYLKRLGFVVRRHERNGRPAMGVASDALIQPTKDIEKGKPARPKKGKQNEHNAAAYHEKLIQEVKQRYPDAKSRGWWIPEQDLQQIRETKSSVDTEYAEIFDKKTWNDLWEKMNRESMESFSSNSDFILGSQEFFSTNNEPDRPLIEELQLKDGQRIKMERLYQTLDIIKKQPLEMDDTKTSEFIEPIVFDVWKSNTYRNRLDKPDFVVVVQHFSEHSVQISQLFSIWHKFQPATLYHALVGDSGTVTFMSLQSAELDFL
jgi:hypothetical protein